MGVPNKGGKFYICTTPQPANLNLAAFEALTFVEVANVVSVPDMGSNVNIVSQSFLANGPIQKYHGDEDAGGGDLEVGYLPADTGQIALNAAALTRNTNYAFKYELADAPSALYTNTIRYQRGIISGPVNTGGASEDFPNRVYAIGFNQRQVEAPPELI